MVLFCFICWLSLLIFFWEAPNNLFFYFSWDVLLGVPLLGTCCWWREFDPYLCCLEFRYCRILSSGALTVTVSTFKALWESQCVVFLPVTLWGQLGRFPVRILPMCNNLRTFAPTIHQLHWCRLRCASTTSLVLFVEQQISLYVLISHIVWYPHIFHPGRWWRCTCLEEGGWWHHCWCHQLVIQACYYVGHLFIFLYCFYFVFITFSYPVFVLLFMVWAGSNR